MCLERDSGRLLSLLPIFNSVDDAMLFKSVILEKSLLTM